MPCASNLSTTRVTKSRRTTVRLLSRAAGRREESIEGSRSSVSDDGTDEE
jgi:hypothetical protein